MIASDVETGIARLRELIAAASVIVPFTGAGKAPGVVTQNIDNLHQSSGIAADDVVELHGNNTYAVCLSCAKRYELSWVKDRFNATGQAPDCSDCGGHIKSATVSFGQ